jgi:hypothetical protein
MDNQVKCICSVLEEINGFASISEFERFQQYLANLIGEKELLPISAHRTKKSFSIPSEKYKCVSCNHIWVLEHPDFPFKGSWKRK